jgi:hypothetical protein
MKMIALGLSGAVAENPGYVTLPALKSEHIHIITSGVEMKLSKYDH